MDDFLFPETLKQKYLDDILNSDFKEAYRGMSLRYCLEEILNNIYCLYSSANKENWINKKNPYDKISFLYESEVISNGTREKLDFIRDVSNQAAHASLHKNLTHDQIDKASNYIKSICLDIIYDHFCMNGMQTSDTTCTVFSVLLPKHRIEVLKRYFEFLNDNWNGNFTYLLSYYDNYVKRAEENDIDSDYLCSKFGTFIPFLGIYHVNHPDPYRLNPPLDEKMERKHKKDKKIKKYDEILLVIDKLSMAYLKNGEYDKSEDYIYQCQSRGMISKVYVDQLIIKLKKLKNEKDKLPIAKTQKDSLMYLNKIESKHKFNNELDQLFTSIIRSILVGTC